MINMGAAIPVVGIIIILACIVALCCVLFPSLPFFHDKVKDHFDLKDEDYEEVKEQDESKG